MKNIELFPKEGKAIVSINPKVFPLEVVYAAAYVLLDKAYFILDGNPENDIKVIIRPKKPKAGKGEIEKIALELHDELINYANFAVQAARNQGIREAIIKRALATNIGTAEAQEKEYCPECEDDLLKEKAKSIEMPKDEDLYVQDPEGIAKPWTPDKAKGLKKPEECK
jgi:His-Xaa-Ser system protein HxsD